jgi:uncharacterized protein YihD (DUF1040 family)
MTAPMTVHDIGVYLNDLVDTLSQMEVNLSDDDAEYSYIYIAQKLAQVSAFTEKLADLSLQLSRLDLAVIKAASNAKIRYNTKLVELTDSVDHSKLPRYARKSWLAARLSKAQQAVEVWESMKKSIRIVKGVLEVKANTLKQLDSDLRLQQKLTQQKTFNTSPAFYDSSDAVEVDINGHV